MRLVVLLAPLVVVAAVACSPGDDDLDLVPPRVLSVEPAAPLLRVEDSITIVFSEALNADTINPDTVVVAARALVTETFLGDLNSPPLSDSRKEQIVPVRLDLDAARSTLVVTPNAPLDPATAYTLLVSDDVRDVIGNPLFNEEGQKSAFRWDFTTDDGPPGIASHDVTTADRPLVAPNRRRFTVVFDQPLRGVDRTTLSVVGRDGAATIEPDVEAVLLDEGRSTATILLAPVDGCFRLSPNAAYAIELGHGITDDEGQDLAASAIEFTTSAACDTTPNTIIGAPFPIGGETTATIRFDTSKASTTTVRWGLPGGPLDCGGATCPAIGPPALVPDSSGATPKFVHSVEITNLEVNATYAFQVQAEDDVGSVAVAAGAVRTAPLARVAVNEVMANARTSENDDGSSSPESEGEYLELANYGEVDVDLSGFALAIDGGDLAGGDTCALTGAPTLAPGAFLVVASSTFNLEKYPGIDATTVHRTTTSTVCGAFTNSRAQSFVLLDGEGRPVSSISSYPTLVPSDDGRSLERTAPDAPDVATSFCFSRSDRGPTPGAENGVVLAGCESD